MTESEYSRGYQAGYHAGMRRRESVERPHVMSLAPERKCSVCWFEGMGRHRCETGWVEAPALSGGSVDEERDSDES